MGIKNYTTTIDPSKTAMEVMRLLAKAGATQISTSYADDGELVGMWFVLNTEFGLREFSLPVRVDGVLAAMKRDRSIPASRATPEQATRVAWRISKDWLDAQIALIEAGLMSLNEVMTPWMLNAAGKTMYSVIREAGLRELES